MLIGSFYSGQGRSHCKRNIPCQDASSVKRITGTWHVMATADGVGSCEKSNIGSSAAVETAINVCVNGFPYDGSEIAILALLRTAFNSALHRIELLAAANEDPIDLYDTTLDVVIFSGFGKLYYGHSGDGGIFVLNSDGEYKEITTVQEGEDANSVVPLRAGNDVWEFGTYEDSIGVVASFTDGIRDKLVPNKLCKQSYTIDVPLANRFMNIDLYKMSLQECNPALSEFVTNAMVYAASAESGITDDFTMGILVDTEVLIADPPYETPDLLSVRADEIEALYDDSTVDKLFRRHLLERYIDVDDKSSFSFTNEEKLAALDKYYPLSSEEAEAYARKYGSTAAAEAPAEKEQAFTEEPAENDDAAKASIEESTQNDDAAKTCAEEPAENGDTKPCGAADEPIGDLQEGGAPDEYPTGVEPDSESTESGN